MGVGSTATLILDAVVVAHVMATLTMFGVIWMVQLVHYPLFAGVGADGFAAYQASHQQRITWIVLPAMVLELITAVWLVFTPPPAWPQWSVWTGLALVTIIWLSTGLLQVPLHNRLMRGFNDKAHMQLVTTNWIRTVVWSFRAGLVGWLLYRMISRESIII